MQPKRIKLDISGVILVDKPLGYSSNQALSKIKWIFSPKKAGHTGTLDPLATGLLPICLGEATKFSSFLLESDKTYEASIKLGFRSNTGDSEGVIVDLNVQHLPALKEIKETLKQFSGMQEQTPPMYSALKFKGKPLYEYARKGEEIERKKRSINIVSLDLIDYSDNVLKITVECSKGTYIRTLASDIGDKLNTGGYLIALRRTAIGSVNVEQAKTLDMIEASDKEARDALIFPIDEFLNYLDDISLVPSAEEAIKDGKTLLFKGMKEGIYRLYNQDKFFLGLGTLDRHGYLKVRRLLALS